MNIFYQIPPILLKKVIIWDNVKGKKIQEFFFNEAFLSINDLDRFLNDKFVFYHKQNLVVYGEYIKNMGL